MERTKDPKSFYDSRYTVGQSQSSIQGIRKFNNWVKSVLINQFTRPGFTVLDLCCGRGGDLLKYKKSEIAFYLGIDLSEPSIQEANQRYTQMKPKFESIFVVGDIADPQYTIKSKLPLQFSEIEIDLVSCQFSLHYLWDSQQHFRRVLENVTQNLKPGGVFLGTVPDSQVLMKKKQVLGQTYGNEYYSIHFDQLPEFSEGFGLRYGFYLADAVGTAVQSVEGRSIDYVPQFLVIMQVFEKIAGQFGLELIYKRNFHQFYMEYKEDYQRLLENYLKVCEIDQEH